MSLTYGIIILLFISSCTGIKKLGPDQILYGGAEIVVEDTLGTKETKTIRESLKSRLKPKPNGKLLWMRPALSMHNSIKEPKKEKSFGYWLKYKLGKPPVLYDPARSEQMTRNLSNYLFHQGYFGARSEYTEYLQGRIMTIKYQVYPGQAHKFDSVRFPAENSDLTESINRHKNESLINPGENYQLDLLRSERERIDRSLKNYGYYFFEPNFLYFNADSLSLPNKVKLKLNLKPAVPQTALWPYQINKIYVVDDFNLGTMVMRDTTPVNGVLYLSASHKIRPEIVAEQIVFKSGSLYNGVRHDQTITNLNALGNFKYVNIQYINEDEEQHTIDAKIFLTPKEKYAISAEINTATKSNNFFGPGVRLNFADRNIFKGSEVFNTSLYGSYEWQINDNITTGITSIEFGLESSVVIPRTVIIKQDFEKRNYLGSTRVAAGVNYFNRVDLYKFVTASSNIKYTWIKRPRISHEFLPMDFSITNMIETSDEFEEYLSRNPSVRRSLEEQFIVGLGYNFTYNALKDKNFIYQGGVDFAGNVLSLVTIFGNDPSSPGEPSKFLGVPYSQFARFRNEFRYHINLGKESKIATRAIASVGVPYGNSSVMPYIRQFFAGGSNSIRAFRSRSIGPGSYVPTDTVSFFLVDQSGDIRLEANMEYRFPISRFLKGALFIDAGNVWLINEDASRPGGKFEWNKFYKELAVGVGYGLRIDADIIVVRFDWAFPIRKPYLPEGERGRDVDFFNRQWRRDNLILNISLGYPF